MGPYIFLTIALTLLVVSLVANILFVFTRQRFERSWLARETRALDRAHAAELRAGQQIDAMLERVGTTPRLDLGAARSVPAVDPDARRYFADDDDPVEDRAWNEYRGEPAEETEVTQ